MALWGLWLWLIYALMIFRPDNYQKLSAGSLQSCILHKLIMITVVESVDVDDFTYLFGAVILIFFMHCTCKIPRLYTLNFLLPLHKYACLHCVDNTPESRLLLCSSLDHTHFPAKRTRQPVTHFTGHFVCLQVTEFILSVQQMPGW